MLESLQEIAPILDVVSLVQGGLQQLICLQIWILPFLAKDLAMAGSCSLSCTSSRLVTTLEPTMRTLASTIRRTSARHL